MTLALGLCLFLAIESPGEVPPPKPSASPPVESVLEADAELLRQHRGYLAFLGRESAVARAEAAWRDLTALPRFEPLARRFDEALHGDVEAQVLFDQFYDQLARDTALRNEVEALYRTTLEEGKQRGRLEDRDLFQGAIAFLQANPDLALRFLKNPLRVNPTPESLAPLLDEFRERPELLQGLLAPLEGVSGNPLAHTRVFPWWEGVARFDAKSGGAHRALLNHFLGRPHHFWVWHQRNLALAADAQARTWIRYWRRKARRTPGLKGDYIAYLRQIEAGPALGAKAEARWTRDHGPVPPWPPKAAPPRLTPLITQDEQNRWPDKNSMMPTYERPGRPSVPMPSMPTAPNMPQRPAKPARPERPERPAETPAP